MSDRPLTGLYQPVPRQLVVRDLLERAQQRLQALGDGELAAYLEDALYQERKRLERQRPKEGEAEALDQLTRALVRGGRSDRLEAAQSLVRLWADEIHGRFDRKIYRFATRFLPRGLNLLLSGRPDRLRDWDLRSERRLKVQGDLAWLRELAREATLVLAPTHVSNLDSPLLGLALYLADLPPFVYGAGLNLFSNPVMGFFMGRLGAYTVDRTKGARLYKDVLKDYSIRCLATRHHSLFFPGGTRSRSGAIEAQVKKGLLGTAVVAWQEMLEARRPDPDIYVVPCTLSMQLVLEANTLINDHLAEAGKQRFIITDDEFAQPRRLAAFGRRVLDLDDSVVCRFGDPLDLVGNPVPRDAKARAEASERRRGYVTDRAGRVQRDDQRDRIYTDRLAEELVGAYARNAEVMVTHLAAWAGWRCLEDAVGSNDPFRLVRVPVGKRQIQRHVYLEKLRGCLAEVKAGAEQGRWLAADLPATAEAVLAQALDRFSRYHRSRALAERGSLITVEDPKLCLYYRNRLSFAELQT